jgi:hypothetical protein
MEFSYFSYKDCNSMFLCYRQSDLDYTEHLHALEREIKTLVEYKVNNVDYVNQLLIRA